MIQEVPFDTCLAGGLACLLIAWIYLSSKLVEKKIMSIWEHAVCSILFTFGCVLIYAKIEQIEADVTVTRTLIHVGFSKE